MESYFYRTGREVCPPAGIAWGGSHPKFAEKMKTLL
jgi:hypothetical protein